MTPVGGVGWGVCVCVCELCQSVLKASCAVEVRGVCVGAYVSWGVNN